MSRSATGSQHQGEAPSQSGRWNMGSMMRSFSSSAALALAIVGSAVAEVDHCHRWPTRMELHRLLSDHRKANRDEAHRPRGLALAGAVGSRKVAERLGPMTGEHPEEAHRPHRFRLSSWRGRSSPSIMQTFLNDNPDDQGENDRCLRHRTPKPDRSIQAS